jgi:hypothetical protein
MGQAKIKRDELKVQQATAKQETPASRPQQIVVPAKAPATKIVIDISGVPIQKRGDLRFKSLLR